MTATHAIEFSVAIHSGFRVGAAYGRDGVDLAVDVEDPLPATHLKGIMRASAVELVTLLDVAPELFDVVFGSVAMPSSWSWSGARPRAGAEWTVSTRHRVEIDPVAGAARKDHLVRAHRVDTRAATFAVHRLHGDSDGTFGGLAAEEALLRVSARYTHHLGAWRRRGWGWVDIRPEPDDDSLLDADLDLLESLSKKDGVMA